MTSPKLLIVDDDADIRQLIQVSCEMRGIAVLGQAADGLEAIAKVEELQPDVVVLDYMMPGMNGELVAGVIRAVAPNVVILAFSAMLTSAPSWSDGFLPKSGIETLPDLIVSLSERGTDHI